MFIKWIIGIALTEVGGMVLGFAMGYYYSHEIKVDDTQAPIMVLWCMIGSMIIMILGTILTAPKRKKIQGG